MINTDIVDEIYSQAYKDVMEEYYVIKNGTPHLHYNVCDQVDGKIRNRFAFLIEEYIKNINTEGHSV